MASLTSYNGRARKLLRIFRGAFLSWRRAAGERIHNARTGRGSSSTKAGCSHRAHVICLPFTRMRSIATLPMRDEKKQEHKRQPARRLAVVGGCRRRRRWQGSSLGSGGRSRRRAEEATMTSSPAGKTRSCTRPFPWPAPFVQRRGQKEREGGEEEACMARGHTQKL